MPDKHGNVDFQVHSEIGRESKRGIVKLVIDGHELRMDLDKAREIRDMLSGGIEAAISDELIFRFLMEKVGLPEVPAILALRDFRVMRQGSDKTVYPT